MPRVSVVVPSYNHAAYLGKALVSALQQDFTDLEVIVVDDASTDDSVGIARSFADPRLTVHVNDTNVGTYATQNRGLSLARGEWVAILNSDDVWHPNKLRAQLDLCDRCPDLNIVACAGRLIDAQGHPIACDPHGSWPTHERWDALPYLIVENRILASSVMFRSSGMTFDGSWRYTGDWRFLVEAAEKGPLGWVNDTLVEWRQHAANSYTRSNAVTLEEVAMRVHLVERFSDSHPEAAAVCAMHLSALLVLCGETKLARQVIRRAVKLDPSSRVIRRRRILSWFPLAFQRRRLWHGEAPNDSVRKEIRELMRD